MDRFRNRLKGIGFKEIGTFYFLKSQKIPQMPSSASDAEKPSRQRANFLAANTHASAKRLFYLGREERSRRANYTYTMPN